MLPQVKLEVIETSPVEENMAAGMNIQHVKDAPLLEYSLVRGGQAILRDGKGSTLPERFRRKTDEGGNFQSPSG